MNDLQEKLAQIIDDAYVTTNGAEVMNCSAIASAIIEALPGLVVPIEWESHQIEVWTTGEYYISRNTIDRRYFVASKWTRWHSEHDTLDEAKAAVEADRFERFFGVKPANSERG